MALVERELIAANNSKQLDTIGIGWGMTKAIMIGDPAFEACYYNHFKNPAKKYPLAEKSGGYNYLQGPGALDTTFPNALIGTIDEADFNNDMQKLQQVYQTRLDNVPIPYNGGYNTFEKNTCISCSRNYYVFCLNLGQLGCAVGNACGMLCCASPVCNPCCCYARQRRICNASTPEALAIDNEWFKVQEQFVANRAAVLKTLSVECTSMSWDIERKAKIIAGRRRAGPSVEYLILRSKPPLSVPTMAR